MSLKVGVEKPRTFFLPIVKDFCRPITSPKGSPCFATSDLTCANSSSIQNGIGDDSTDCIEPSVFNATLPPGKVK